MKVRRKEKKISTLSRKKNLNNKKYNFPGKQPRKHRIQRNPTFSFNLFNLFSFFKSSPKISLFWTDNELPLLPSEKALHQNLIKHMQQEDVAI